MNNRELPCPPMPRRPLVFLPTFLLLLALRLGADPVEFSFRPPEVEGNPFARELWAEVETPAEARLQLPAFYAGDGIWAVRTRAAERGNYRLLTVTEFDGTRLVPTPHAAVGSDRARVRAVDPLGSPVRVDPRTGRHFLTGAAELYYPIGGNIPWASGAEPEDYYPDVMSDFQAGGLNWGRIWMAHWGKLNLDWTEAETDEPLAPGELDLNVARRWDRIIAAAEAHGIRLQVVLQHHGQYSTSVNSNWADNPWNATRGGFLATPEAFFTDSRARQYTRDKYRYIVARWGYSSAVMAWELFNEVMWVDARRGENADQTAVANWHTEMARHLRRYDVHHHLITTSDDDLGHPLFEAMDYLQPHLYGTNMILGVQQFSADPAKLNRPIFYGEIGDDNMVDLSSAQRTTGFVHPLLAWSGLFGPGAQPAQIWHAETLRQQGRWPEMESVGAFVAASGLAAGSSLTSFQPIVLGGDTAPLVLEPGHYWQRGPNPEFNVPLDGRVPPEWMEFRRILTSAAGEHPFPSRVTLHLEAPAGLVARLMVRQVSNPGAALRISVDGAPVVERTWLAASAVSPAATNVELPFRIPFGSHTVVIENPTGPDWVDIAGLDLGLSVPALVAVGRRNPDRVVLWLRHRANLLSPADDEELTATSATVQIPDLPAGRWRLSWWDEANRQAKVVGTLNHDGGMLSLDTPAILRHGAGWLERVR